MENEEKKIEEAEVDPFVDLEFKEMANTAHNHFYVEDPKQDPNNEMTQLICTGCPSGCNIDPKLFQLKDGKIIKKDEVITANN